MPQTRRLTWAQLRVGLMSIVAISILIVLVFLLSGKGGFFRKTAMLRTYVDDAASLKEGAVVRLNGIDVGNVRKVQLSGSSDPRRTIEVLFDVDRRLLPSIPKDSQTTISPEGVFGDKYINITRGQTPNRVSEGDELPSIDTREFQEIVRESYNVLASLNGITKRIDSITAQVEKGQGTIGKLLYDDTLYNRIDAVVKQGQEVAALAGSGKGTIGRLLNDDQIFNQASTVINRVDTILTDMQSGKGTLGMLLYDPTIFQNANRLLTQANKTIDGVNAGEGTLGKFLKDDALFKQVGNTLGRVDNMLDRVNGGQGTIGQLLVNRALYDSITGMTTDTNALIKDIRANPKKFLRVKLSIF